MAYALQRRVLRVHCLRQQRNHVRQIQPLADVPLAEMFGYATDLRSATQGRATYTMEFARYSEAPSNVADGIIGKNTF
mgnify:CR=1 FL=1